MKIAGPSYRLYFGMLILLLPLLFLANISLGSVHIPMSSSIHILFGGEAEKTVWSKILYNIRLPKALTAIIAGAGLGLSGLQMQTLFRNPLAGPFVLGISSGAGLGVALLVLSASFIVIWIPELNILNSSVKVLAASAGAFFVLALVLLVSIKTKDSMVLLIVGLMFGTFASAIISVLQYFSEAEQIQAYLMWTFGSLGGVSKAELIILYGCCLLGIMICVGLIKPLNAILLGENYALSMGIKTKSMRVWLIVSTSLLAGSITAYCGPLAFLGLAVPHLARILFQSSNHKTLIPATLLIGANLLLLCDLIAQMPGSEKMLPINAITSLFGAPVVIWLIIRRNNNFQRSF